MNDERIRERFHALRTETERSAPDFRPMLERARREGAVARTARRRRLVWATGISGAALAAALAAVLLTRGRSDGDAEFELLVASYSADAAAWRSPTSALLDVPGSSLISSMPSVGVTHEGGL